MEKRSVEYVLIDNIKYEIVMEKSLNDKTFLYLTNINDDSDMLIRKYTHDNLGTLKPLDNDKEFEEAMLLINN